MKETKLTFLFKRATAFNSVLEHLDGATVEFVHPDKNEKETLISRNCKWQKIFL